MYCGKPIHLVSEHSLGVILMALKRTKSKKTSYVSTEEERANNIALWNSNNRSLAWFTK
jgi:hypothetical protein